MIQEGVQTASGTQPSGTVLLKGDRHESWLSRFAAIEHISPEIQKKRGNPLALAATIDWLEKRGITFTSHVFTDHDHIKWKKVEKCGELEGGEAFLGCVADAASKLGADIRSYTKTEEFLIEDGRVAGVRATTVSGEELVVRAPAAIVAGVDFTSLRNGPTGAFSPVVPSGRQKGRRRARRARIRERRAFAHALHAPAGGHRRHGPTAV